MVLQLKVHGPRGELSIVDVCEDEQQLEKVTVLHLKRKIIKELGIDSDVRMVFRTETLEDSVVLPAYGIKHMSTIHTLLMLPGGH